MSINKKDLTKLASRAFREKQRQLNGSLAEAEAVVAKPSAKLVPREEPFPTKKPRSEFLHLVDESRGFDPFAHLDAPKPKHLESDEFLMAVKAQLDKKNERISPEIFRSLCATAIGRGGVALQEFFGKFGDDIIPRNVDATIEEWSLPSPNTTRKILEFFSTFTSDQFTGSKLPWRHAQCAPPAAEPKLPD